LTIERPSIASVLRASSTFAKNLLELGREIGSNLRGMLNLTLLNWGEEP
jgi:hypothetical protein